MDLKSLEQAIRAAWGKDTWYPPAVDLWTPEKPELGQCTVTALVVQDYFGGELLYCKKFNHYWNRLSDGTEVDLTRAQFPEGTSIVVDEVRQREDVLNGESATRKMTAQRYQLLNQRVEQNLRG